MNLAELTSEIGQISDAVGNINCRWVDVPGCRIGAVTIKGNAVVPEGSLTPAYYCTEFAACEQSLEGFKSAWYAAGNPGCFFWRRQPELVTHTQTAEGFPDSVYYSVYMRVAFPLASKEQS
jgi:hypothetical protein